jgi:membrane dipeptidase
MPNVPFSPPPGHELDRRAFLALTAAGALAPRVGVATRPSLAPSAQARWKDAIIINTLGAINNPNVRPADTAGGSSESARDRLTRMIDARALREAHQSGLTAFNMTLGPVVGPQDPFEATVADVAAWDGFIRQHPNDLLKVLSAADIEGAKAESKVGVIYGVQNTIMLGDQVGRVDLFTDLGMRIIQLTYNVANRVGDGSMAPENRGLTPFGHEVVERLNANRIIVDLGHSGQAICLDAARASKQPIAISHTGCRALSDRPRNKTDEELRLVASKGGYVGIYFMSVFLTMSGQATADDVIAHIEHAIQVCGEDHVGVGTDGSVTQIDDIERYRAVIAKEIAERRAAGISAPGESTGGLLFVPDVTGMTQFYDLGDRLLKRGHSRERVEKILGRNFLRFAKEVWGS